MTLSAQLDAFAVELPVAFDPRWNRIPGITVDRATITVDPEKYFFRFENSTWLLCDWNLVASQLLGIEESAETAVEQLALEFVQEHGYSTSDAGRVLATAWEVYSYLFREEHLPTLGLPQITADHLRMLREAATFMALNKVELDGHISNVGPCWFFPAATSVVYELDEEDGGMLDEVYHGTGVDKHCSTSTAASSRSRRTPRSVAGWSTDASPCPISPAEPACRTAPRCRPSAPS
ncbi:hypothetical protein [Microbispora bryophytorum]|uniref:Uncharacterized protein n=1 Tax=Microbispora bryophytorum TaxID=1460882 RepID=A0A8H9LCR5_9ACTN|nr:hypothetical protein [Microbispora bryophytorum]GGO26818.1 hypothetical protein GCM10011574_59660 [Microbispora bryophytorum]